MRCKRCCCRFLSDHAVAGASSVSRSAACRSIRHGVVLPFNRASEATLGSAPSQPRVPTSDVNVSGAVVNEGGKAAILLASSLEPMRQTERA